LALCRCNAMQAVVTESTGTHGKAFSSKQHCRATYSNAMDQRKHPIRGLRRKSPAVWCFAQTGCQQKSNGGVF